MLRTARRMGGIFLSGSRDCEEGRAAEVCHRRGLQTHERGSFMKCGGRGAGGPPPSDGSVSAMTRKEGKELNLSLLQAEMIDKSLTATVLCSLILCSVYFVLQALSRGVRTFYPPSDIVPQRTRHQTDIATEDSSSSEDGSREEDSLAHSKLRRSVSATLVPYPVVGVLFLAGRLRALSADESQSYLAPCLYLVTISVLAQTMLAFFGRSSAPTKSMFLFKGFALLLAVVGVVAMVRAIWVMGRAHQHLPLPAPVGHILNLSSCFFMVYALSTTINWLQQVGFFLSSSCLRRSLIKILFYSCGSQQVATKTNDIVTKTHYHNFHFFFYSPTTDVVTSAKKWFSSLNFSPRKLSGGAKSSIAWL